MLQAAKNPDHVIHMIEFKKSNHFKKANKSNKIKLNQIETIIELKTHDI